MDLREAYAWMLFVGMAVALLAASAYFFISALLAYLGDAPVWIGSPFDHLPSGELFRYMVLAGFGVVTTLGMALFGLLGAFVRAKELIR